MYARACKLATGQWYQDKSKTELLKDAGALRETLKSKLATIYAMEQNGSSGIRSIWISEDDADAVTTALSSKLDQAQEDIEKLLFEVVSLEVN
jgi:hypothetical protein